MSDWIAYRQHKLIVIKAGKSKIKLLEHSVPGGGAFSVSLMAIFSVFSCGK